MSCTIHTLDGKSFIAAIDREKVEKRVIKPLSSPLFNVPLLGDGSVTINVKYIVAVWSR